MNWYLRNSFKNEQLHMAASDQRNFIVHMNMGSDDNKSSLRAARPAQLPLYARDMGVVV